MSDIATSAHLKDEAKESRTRKDIEEGSVIHLSPQSFDAFVAALDKPMSKETAELLEKKPVWE